MNRVRPETFIVGVVCMLLASCTTSTHQEPNPAFTWSQGGVIRGDRSEKKLALVFTGGEHGGGSQHILDTLARKNVKASFFVTGDYVAVPGYDVWLRRMVDEGHTLGPHSHAHLLYAPWENRDESLVTEAQFKNDLQVNIDELRAYGAMPEGEPIHFIPPYEWYSQQHAAWSAEMGCRLFNFTPGSGSHRDWAPEGHKAFRPSRQILADILECEKSDPDGLNGHLLLLHLGSQREDKMYLLLGELIDTLHDRGYRFVRVQELLTPWRVETHTP
jgi:peptidoglycan/xylan/chitin deacetylase (PgdA/CDA1 family)